jgi:thermostable 8-oxoguanine DNA glycosylase
MPTSKPAKSKRTYRKFSSDGDTLNYKFSYNDRETTALHSALNHNDLVDLSDLRRVSLWKLDRVLSVSDETLKKLRALAKAKDLKVDDDRSRETIELLVGSAGVGFPMASAILKFIRPDVFRIIDVRAYRALTGTKPYYSTYSFARYVKYAKALAEIAERTGLPLRDIDEQLYCFDEKLNGKI